MANYNEMVQGLARARDRSVAEHKRVTEVVAMIAKAIHAELATPRRVVTTTALEAHNHYLHQPAEMTVFKNELSLLLQDEDDSAGEPSATLVFAMSYGIMASNAEAALSERVNVTVNDRRDASIPVASYDAAQLVAREIVAACDALLRLGGGHTVGVLRIIG